MATPKKSAAPVRKSSKKEVLESIEEVQETLDFEDSKRPDQLAAERKLDETIQLAASASSDSQALQDIAQLKIGLGKTLSQISEQMETEISRFEAVQKAILLKDRELQEIYEIQRRADTLTALVEAERRKRDEMETEMSSRKANLEAEIATIRDQWQRDKSEQEARIKAERDAEKKQRDRDREDYDYNFKREQTLARNKFADEQAKQEKDLAAKRETAERELSAREKAVAERETELKELRAQVASLTKERDGAISSAVNSLRDKLTAEHKSVMDLQQRTAEGEKNVLLARIEGLDKNAKEQAGQISKLSTQLDAAYAKVQDIAVKALEGASQSKALQNLQSSLVESARKSEK